MENQNCIAPGLEHNLVFVAQTPGGVLYKCTFCDQYHEEFEDSQP